MSGMYLLKSKPHLQMYQIDLASTHVKKRRYVKANIGEHDLEGM